MVAEPAEDARSAIMRARSISRSEERRRPSCSTSLTAITDGTLAKREFTRPAHRQDFAAADTDKDGNSDKMISRARWKKRFNAANPDNDGTIDDKELKTDAGRSLARLLK